MLRLFLTFFMTLLVTGSVSAAERTIVPNFSLNDSTGEKVSLSDFRGKIVVLEWINPDCPFVKRHYREKTMLSLEKKYREKGIVWLAINTTHYMGPEVSERFRQEHKIEYKILVDRDGKVGRAYRAQTTPHMFVIGPDGARLYEGAIDDDPHGDREPVERANYVGNALAARLSGAEVPISFVKPYGCSVKYAS